MSNLSRFRYRIEEKRTKTSVAPVLIVALGDSVTQGCMEHGRIDHEGVYHNCLKRMLEEKHPDTTFSVINAGVGGESAPGGLARLERDVTSHHPDLVIIAFALNDACSRQLPGLEDFKNTIREMIKRVRETTEAEVMLLTPNMMITRMNDAIADCHQHLAKPFMHVQSSGILDAYVQALRDIAAEMDTALTDVYAEWRAREAKGEDITAKLCNGLNHPSADMQFVTAKLIMKEINEK